MELRLDLEDESGNKIVMNYQEFRVDGSENKYQLHISGLTLSGQHDFMAPHNNMYFTTKDRDNDHHDDKNCAQVHKGGWWYKKCYYTNPNGLHDPNADNDAYIAVYDGSSVIYYPSYEMKIRPKSCPLPLLCD